MEILESLSHEGKSEEVQAVLHALDRRGDSHPLLALFRANWLRKNNRLNEAIAMLEASVNKWKRPYLDGLLKELTGKM
jgi:hypothetical protein